jgi:hypothetical protein
MNSDLRTSVLAQNFRAEEPSLLWSTPRKARSRIPWY